MTAPVDAADPPNRAPAVRAVNNSAPSPLALVRHVDGPSLLRAVGPWLERDEAAHNLLLGVAATVPPDTVAPAPGTFLAHVVRDDAPVLAALRTPPRGLVLSQTDTLEAVDLVADALVETSRDLPWVSAAPAVAERFVERWQRATGVTATLQMQQRIYALSALVPPRVVTGRLRVADTSDAALVAAWLTAFGEDANLPAAERHVTVAEAEARIARSLFVLWEDGAPVSMAASLRSTTHGGGVTAVYTPASLRGRGYASACVAALSARILASGKRFCFLYADQSNPTSNGIYTALGYHPVADVALWALTPPR